MPMPKAQRERYPDNWLSIAHRVKDRAGWRCENCGIEHGEERPNRFGDPFSEVITVAHLGVAYPDGTPGDKTDKMDCRSENLCALCTRCHLRLDVDEHLATRLINRRRRVFAVLLAAHGNKTLFEEM